MGLPYEREPEQLHLQERSLLLSLGNKVIETAILTRYNLKSYGNYEHYAICRDNLKNIGKAYNIAENTSAILQLKGLPNLKEIYTQKHLNFDKVFKIRHLPAAKYYRKWINQVGENSNAQEVSIELINEIEGEKKYINTAEGKLLKKLCVLTAGGALTSIIGGIGTAIGLGLGILDTFWLDNILKGKNPAMFIEELKQEIQKEDK